VATPSFELREFFHLALLRHLGTRLSGRCYAVKGGICLRFFHRSPRLSEDMDLDIVSQVRVETLRNAVDSVIDGRAMLATLLPAGISGLTATKPKQTDTTQRWKVALQLNGGGSLPTKIEFSRRRDQIRYSTGIPDGELLKKYKTAPFAAQHYDAAQMAAHKILALASPARNALRDLFDLNHLLFGLGSRPEEIAPLVGEATILAASEKVLAYTFEDFQEQVLPYLTAELMPLYRGSAAFDRQKRAVADALLEMAR
jgi:predicted nucleotidyltransferase component of viral defense system